MDKHNSQKGKGHSTILLFIFDSRLSTLLLSLLDYKEGFGGKFGVQKVQDKSAVGWDHKEAQQQHDSQKGASVQKVSVVCLYSVFSL